MLRTRVLTALVLVPAALYLVLLAPPLVFTWVTAAVVLIGAWEFQRLADLKGRPGGWALLIAQAVILTWLIQSWERWTSDPVAVFQLGGLLWLVMFSTLLRFRPLSIIPTAYRIRGFLTALVILSLGWMAITWLRLEPEGQWWLMVLLVCIWAADIGAYFTGRALGKAKLAPAISPGKTRAGLYGGVVAGALATVVTVALIPSISGPVWALLVIGLVTSLVSVGGDLLISLHKRTVGCKDTGKIFPGHGGVLDRLDSLLAGAPFFALGKLLAGL